MYFVCFSSLVFQASHGFLPVVSKFSKFICSLPVYNICKDMRQTGMQKEMLSRAVPIAVFDKQAFYLLTQEQFYVGFMRMIDLKQSPGSLNSVADITVMILTFTVEVNYEIIQSTLS